jgi:hypothetical protein
MTAILQSFSNLRKTVKNSAFYFFFEDREKIGRKMAIWKFPQKQVFFCVFFGDIARPIFLDWVVTQSFP